MAYSDEAAFDYIEAAFRACKNFVEIQIAGRADPIRARGLEAFDDKGFVVVGIEAGRTAIIRADRICTIVPH